MAAPPRLTRATLLHLEDRYRPRPERAGWLSRLGGKPVRDGLHFVGFNDHSIVPQATLEGRRLAATATEGALSSASGRSAALASRSFRRSCWTRAIDASATFI
jgi:hypothetical protein